MASFSSFLTTKKFPSRSTLRSILEGPLTLFKVLVYGFFFLLCTAVFILLITINNRFLITVPARGGTLTEGVIGAPHFINPLLATTDTDTRLVALVYGSLMQTQSDGSVVTSLAQSYTVSPDGDIYTVTLLPKTAFDDGKPLTSDDVAFTVTKLQDNSISTQSQYWQDVSVATPDASTIVFTLPAPDPTFLSHLAFGILPKHVWQNIADQNFDTTNLNLHPIGAGLFKVSDISYQNGIPSSVVLVRNNRAVQGKPLLNGLTVDSFANQSDLLNAVNSKAVDFSFAVSPDTLVGTPLSTEITAQSIPTSNTVSIYRSQSDTTLANATTVAAVSEIIDKNAIIATVQHGYGTPAGVLLNSSSTKLPITGFSLAVENDPTLLLAAQTIAAQLSADGIAVSVNAFDPGTFQADIAAGAFPLFLARSSDQDIPASYASVIPLYTESIPYLFDSSVHTIPPETFQSPAQEYDDVKDWYTDTNRLWK